MEKGGNVDKGGKIHPLKGKVKVNFNQKYSGSPQKSPPLRQSPEVYVRNPYVMTRPIVIRYIDPRLVPFFHQLGALTSRCEEIAARDEPISPSKRQKNLYLLMESTKKLTEKVNQIIEQTAEGDQHIEPLQNKPELVSIELIGSSVREGNEYGQRKNGEQEFLNLLNTVRQDQQRISELQAQNRHLKQSLQFQKYHTNTLQEQNKALAFQLAKVVEQKNQLLSNIKLQLSKLKDKKQVFTESIERLNKIYEER